ncbi:unnamed protein product [Rotaria magnacalcarata]|uniref:Histone RNA hairpin-binding protein RNA-binding domain-containing protein n=4 Tax=Rotaria magnacalcarata TaxID=392030 RepID=A0A817A9C4_9BILA|nr:unnamed protein product [Rotaria magnacalcarata]CAF1684789.1 unnamed protein product [Rotaria magnacalcarata]CAF2049992.1 unnamed protein product [Rotaria magnacalcarata]CAF2207030.1 unnamed protein product [Rotaria magnacalcarata]CAF2250276.1 unnamed protein product [Rotaria magnacalcarata]
MSASNTPNRIRHTPKTTRAYESSDGGTPSSARLRSKRYCANETNENSPRRNKYHPYSAPVQFDENANEPFHDENHRTTSKPSTPNNRPNRLHIKNDEKPKTPKPSFEEEQQELQKSLSKDWCDKMDNEEAEEKKLHSFVLYLKQFPVHENKTTEELLGSIECCPKELVRRQKEISKGKLSKVYEAYASTIPRKSRTRQHPRTPCKYAKMSRRGFDGAIKAWRRKLHEFGAEKIKENGGGDGNNDDDSVSIASSQRSDGYSTPSSSSMSMEEIDENFLPDLYDFEESLTVNPHQDKDIELKFGSVIDLEVADSMDTIVNNVDSRSAMAFD